MVDVSLVVIDKPEEGTRPVANLKSATPEPWFTGEGPVNLLCGDCGFKIVEGAESATFMGNLVVTCPNCGKYNETQTSSGGPH